MARCPEVPALQEPGSEDGAAPGDSARVSPGAPGVYRFTPQEVSQGSTPPGKGPCLPPQACSTHRECVPRPPKPPNMHSPLDDHLRGLPAQGLFHRNYFNILDLVVVAVSLISMGPR